MAPPPHHPYTANYCEENVWHLAGDPRLHAGVRRVLVVAGLGPSIPLWNQRLAEAPGEPVFWDYHVMLAVSGAQRWMYDLDTALPFPCPLEVYVEATFGPARQVPPLYRPWFRVLDAETYLRTFASDRSHMRGPDGTWSSLPPPWPPLLAEPPLLPLAAAIDMEDTAVPGRICDLGGLLDALAP